jgi:polyferredoxin
MIENVYRLQLMNASEQPLVLSLGVEGLPGMSVALADRASVPLTGAKQSGTVESTSHINVASASNRLIAVVVRAPAEGAQPGPQPIRFTTKSLGADGAVLTEIKEASSFIFPR